jgi:hypothetical protein
MTKDFSPVYGSGMEAKMPPETAYGRSMSVMSEMTALQDYAEMVISRIVGQRPSQEQKAGNSLNAINSRGMIGELDEMSERARQSVRNVRELLDTLHSSL